MTTLEHGNLLDSETVRYERMRLISALSRGLFAAKKILEREAMNTPIECSGWGGGRLAQQFGGWVKGDRALQRCFTTGQLSKRK